LDLISDREGSAGKRGKGQRGGRRKPNFDAGDDDKAYQMSSKQDIGNYYTYECSLQFYL